MPPVVTQQKPKPLSPTQLRVAQLSDRTAERIAELLDMNVRTVRAHLNAARERLGVESKRDIIRALEEQGYPLDDD